MWTDSYGPRRAVAYRFLNATGWENAAANRVCVTAWMPPNPNGCGWYSTRAAIWLTLTGRRKRVF